MHTFNELAMEPQNNWVSLLYIHSTGALNIKCKYLISQNKANIPVVKNVGTLVIVIPYFNVITCSTEQALWCW